MGRRQKRYGAGEWEGDPALEQDEGDITTPWVLGCMLRREDKLDRRLVGELTFVVDGPHVDISKSIFEAFGDCFESDLLRLRLDRRRRKNILNKHPTFVVSVFLIDVGSNDSSV